MFASVLIANRGEIACRIIKTAKRLGLRTIAVYSEADAASLHVREADEAHLIGPAPANESYLRIERVIETAKRANAHCIHPGYGFLSENAGFAEACAAAGIVFVGPPPDAIRAMGLKGAAKAIMERAGVPIVPGYHGDRQDPKFLKEKAYEIGYPVLIKAIAGGGGKGMRRVEKHAEFEACLEAAMREAQSAFGDSRVLIEKYVTAPRHIEIQVFADQHGHVVHLNERDCSLQRRHQKVIEEAPAPGMTSSIRHEMGHAAISAAKAVGYVGAGTVEFIADGAKGLRADRFWFMEMNTRLQVEHPVTEAITNLDLVEWQFRVASGEKLPLMQRDVPLNGHAVEARLYAEDPARGFLPSTGRLLGLSIPSGAGIRVDQGVCEGDDVTPFYDPMIAKIIAHADTRERALEVLAQALDRTIVAGPRTNLDFLARLARAPAFRAMDFDTGFIDRHIDTLVSSRASIDASAAAAGIERLLQQARRQSPGANSPWDVDDGFQLSGPRRVALPIDVDGEAANAAIVFGAHGLSVSVGGRKPAREARAFAGDGAVYVLHVGRQTIVRLKDFEAIDVEHLDQGGILRAPMHGKVIAILVEPGALVKKGQKLAILEAMKMEHALSASSDGAVAEIAASPGQQVAEGAKIMQITPVATD